MSVQNLVSLAFLIVHCCIALASRINEKNVLEPFEKLESTLLALESEKAREDGFSFRSMEKLHNLHVLYLLNAKSVVYKSLMFWSEKDCCRIAKPDEIEAESRRLDTLTNFLKKLSKFVVLKNPNSKNTLNAISCALRSAKRCWYRLQLIMKQSSIGERSEDLSTVSLDPEILKQAILSADAAIKQSPKASNPFHSPTFYRDTDSENEQRENYCWTKSLWQNIAY